MYLNMHCSTIYNSQDMEASRCPLADEWIRKLWYIYTMEYYLVQYHMYNSQWEFDV